MSELSAGERRPGADDQVLPARAPAPARPGHGRDPGAVRRGAPRPAATDARARRRRAASPRRRAGHPRIVDAARATPAARRCRRSTACAMHTTAPDHPPERMPSHRRRPRLARRPDAPALGRSAAAAGGATPPGWASPTRLRQYAEAVHGWPTSTCPWWNGPPRPRRRAHRGHRHGHGRPGAGRPAPGGPGGRVAARRGGRWRIRRDVSPGPSSSARLGGRDEGPVRWTGPSRRSPDGIRTRATALRGRRARPLHNGAVLTTRAYSQARNGSRWGTRTRT